MLTPDSLINIYKQRDWLNKLLMISDMMSTYSDFFERNWKNDSKNDFEQHIQHRTKHSNSIQRFCPINMSIWRSKIIKHKSTSVTRLMSSTAHTSIHTSTSRLSWFCLFESMSATIYAHLTGIYILLKQKLLSHFFVFIQRKLYASFLHALHYSLLYDSLWNLYGDELLWVSIGAHISTRLVPSGRKKIPKNKKPLSIS